MTKFLATLIALSVMAAPTAAQTTVRSGPTGLEPDTVFSSTGGPRVVLLRSTGAGVGALRLFVPLRESAVEAGAGWMLRELALDRMEALARPVGATVGASRTPWGLAYSVVGAAADFEYLAYLLREAVAEPDVGAPGFQEAFERLTDEAVASLETPRGRIVSDLRAQIAAGAHPPEGTPGSVSALGRARVLEVWRRSHQASGMTLVVSAPVVPEVILAATRGLGAPEEAAAAPLDAPAPTQPRRSTPYTLRTWYGEAWHGATAEDPRGPVTARLVSEALRARAQAFEASVELWELPDRWVVAAVGAAYQQNVGAMRQAIAGVLTDARSRLSAASVDAAVSEVMNDILMRARTPSGLVSLVGRAMEATGDPGAAASQVGALSAVDVDAVRRFLDELIARGPARAEVRP